jgi:hypothetical protein
MHSKSEESGSLSSGPSGKKENGVRHAMHGREGYVKYF